MGGRNNDEDCGVCTIKLNNERDPGEKYKKIFGWYSVNHTFPENTWLK